VVVGLFCAKYSLSRMIAFHYSTGIRIGWQWRDFFTPYLRQLFSRHDEGRLCKISAIVSSRFSKIVIRYGHFLKSLIQFCWNNATNLHHLTSHSTACCPRHRDSRFLWRYFNISTWKSRQTIANVRCSWYWRILILVFCACDRPNYRYHVCFWTHFRTEQ